MLENPNLFELPDEDILYQALLDKDPVYEGFAYVCVKSTGIFCRLTCPARKPRRENCTFLDNVVDCIDAGYRPCKRCKPLASSSEADPIVRDLVDRLEQDPAMRWSEDTITRLGHDPSTVRRVFKRHFGVTFLEMARLRRIRHGAENLRHEDDVLAAQLDAGFESGSGFRAAFARVLGQPPAEFSKNAELAADWIETPIGAMIAVSDKRALHLLEFFDRKGLPNELKKLQQKHGPICMGRHPPTEQITKELNDYFSGNFQGFNTRLALHGSPFTQDVWQALIRIPVGQTLSYSTLAKTLARPSATRAVARANGANQLSIIIPCHRILGADGSLTGYGGGLWRKQWLINHERQMTQS